MRCTSCGTDNTPDSRFCKRCGERFPVAAEPAPVAVPGDRVVGDGGATVRDPGPPVGAGDEPVLARPTVDAAAVEASSEPTVRGQPVPRAVAAEAREGDGERRGGLLRTSPETPQARFEGGAGRSEDGAGPARLEPPTGLGPADGSMVASLSVRLSEVGVRAPRKLALSALLVAVALFALGSGATYLALRLRAEPAATVATGDPTDGPGLVIGMPVLEAAPGSAAGPASAGTSTTPRSGAAPAGGAEGSGSRPRAPVGGSGAAPAGGGASPGAGARPGSAAEPASGGGREEPAAAGSTAGSGSGGGDPVPPPVGDDLEERDPAVASYAGQVRYVIGRFYSARAQSCFERASRERSEPVYGTVVVRFVVGEDGNVQSATAVRNDTGSADLGDCLAGQVRSWRLPAPPGGQATMEMPFSQ